MGKFSFSFISINFPYCTIMTLLYLKRLIYYIIHCHVSCFFLNKYIFLRRVTSSVLRQARHSFREQRRCKQLLYQSMRNGKLLFNQNIHGDVRLLHGASSGGQFSSLLRNHQRLTICLNQQQRRQLMLLRILRAASKVRYIFLGAAGTAGVSAKLVSLTTDQKFEGEINIVCKKNNVKTWACEWFLLWGGQFLISITLSFFFLSFRHMTSGETSG